MSPLSHPAHWGPARLKAGGSRLFSYFLLWIVPEVGQLVCFGAVYEPSFVVPPPPVREMRAVWIASVSNIDWPSTNSLDTAGQKTELLAILDCAARLKLNTVILQVRPACDALYNSPFEPWSEYLTGKMGRAPQPYYDPLEFAVAEAHKRGLELHAWFNPYRARHSMAKSPIASNHISKVRPNLVRQYGKSLWLDPGDKQVQEYCTKVILDVVKRYDIDGVHLDDYFYPYQEQDSSGKELDFPDEATWRRHGLGQGVSRDDWRRENVNTFIRQLYSSIKNAKPTVKFGISPFGIWRPGNPPQIQGYDAYAKLYADSRKWLINGWLDYFAPQLYWAIDPPPQSFPVLLKWWGQQNPKGRLLVAGMDSTKAARRWPVDEIVEQIRLTRKQPGIGGHVHWSMKSLMRNEALAAALDRKAYANPALVPALPWLNSRPPGKPGLTVRLGSGPARANWSIGPDERVWLWAVQTRSHGQWVTRVLPGATRSASLGARPPEVVAVSAIDRTGNAGRPVVVQLRP
jgi:uncharacterized lipoprotein YddW (UPF0748 family)